MSTSSLTSRSRALTAQTLLGIAIATSIAACGGGGGGSTDSGSGPSTPLSITSSNAKAVARLTMSSVNAAEAAGTASDGLVGTLVGAASALAQPRSVQTFAVHALASSQRQAAAAATVPCAGGGNITTTLTDTNSNRQLDRAGESLVFAANQCVTGSGYKITGGFTLALTQYQDTRQHAFNLTFNAFTAEDLAAGLKFALNGNLKVSVSFDNSTVLSDSFSMSTTQNNQTHSFTAENYLASSSYAYPERSHSLNGTFSGGDLGNHSVTITTPSNMVFQWSDSYPSQGIMVIKGSGGSALKVEALNSSQARLSVDANGDGTYESSVDVNWVDID